MIIELPVRRHGSPGIPVSLRRFRYGKSNGRRKYIFFSVMRNLSANCVTDGME